MNSKRKRTLLRVAVPAALALGVAGLAAPLAFADQQMEILEGNNPSNSSATIECGDGDDTVRIHWEAPADRIATVAEVDVYNYFGYAEGEQPLYTEKSYAIRHRGKYSGTVELSGIQADQYLLLKLGLPKMGMLAAHAPDC